MEAVASTYSEIARDTGISLSHISLVLRGKRNPTLEVAEKLAKSMQITLDELVEKIRENRDRD